MRSTSRPPRLAACVLTTCVLAAPVACGVAVGPGPPPTTPPATTRGDDGAATRARPEPTERDVRARRPRPGPPPAFTRAPTVIDVVDAPTAAAKGALAGSVLVWQDAPLYFARGGRGPHVRLGVLAGPRRDRGGLVVPMDVVAGKGEWLEVTPGTSRCVDARLDAGALAPPHLFIRRADLAPMVIRDHDVRFPDGTGVTLWAGTPAVPTADARWRLAMATFPIAAALPADAVGFAHPRTSAILMATSDRWRLEAGVTVTLGDDAYVVPARPDEWLAPSVDLAGGIARIPLGDPCGAITVAAPTSAVAPHTPAVWPRPPSPRWRSAPSAWRGGCRRAPGCAPRPAAPSSCWRRRSPSTRRRRARARCASTTPSPSPAPASTRRRPRISGRCGCARRPAR
ncbi:MAG: hypothetical protein R2939_15140 [Kofleriaceae bacterium]